MGGRGVEGRWGMGGGRQLSALTACPLAGHQPHGAIPGPGALHTRQQPEPPVLGPGALGVTVKSLVPDLRPSSAPAPCRRITGLAPLEPGLCAVNSASLCETHGCPAHSCLGLSVLELGPGLLRGCIGWRSAIWGQPLLPPASLPCAEPCWSAAGMLRRTRTLAAKRLGPTSQPGGSRRSPAGDRE